jgi:hypothetical protein
MTLALTSAILSSVNRFKPAKRGFCKNMKRLLFFLLLTSPLPAREKYDLLIKGATVLDPKNNLYEIHFESPEWTAVDHALEAGVAARIPVFIPTRVGKVSCPQSAD